MGIQLIIPIQLAAQLDEKVLSGITGIMINGKVLRVEEDTEVKGVSSDDAISVVQDMISKNKEEVVHNTVPIPHNSTKNEVSERKVLTGKGLKRFRVDEGFSGRQYADLIGIGESTLWKFETGGPAGAKTVALVRKFLLESGRGNFIVKAPLYNEVSK